MTQNQHPAHAVSRCPGDLGSRGGILAEVGLAQGDRGPGGHLRGGEAWLPREPTSPSSLELPEGNQDLGSSSHLTGGNRAWNLGQWDQSQRVPAGGRGGSPGGRGRAALGWWGGGRRGKGPRSTRGSRAGGQSPRPPRPLCPADIGCSPDADVGVTHGTQARSACRGQGSRRGRGLGQGCRVGPPHQTQVTLPGRTFIGLPGSQPPRSRGTTSRVAGAGPGAGVTAVASSHPGHPTGSRGMFYSTL